MRQAVTNLVENASRFIKPGGHINVELFGMNGNSIIAVKDDGCGFGDVDPKLLFDRFYRTDASRTRGTGGTGLGLAIVKSIAEAHDGTVEAVNLPRGRGVLHDRHPLHPRRHLGEETPRENEKRLKESLVNRADGRCPVRSPGGIGPFATRAP